MVIVETARGMELGHVMIGNCQVDDSRIVAPLKPVQRRATDEDLERYKQNYAKKGEAMKICQGENPEQRSGHETGGRRIHN